jgi:hypothetical protein
MKKYLFRRIATKLIDYSLIYACALFLFQFFPVYFDELYALSLPFIWVPIEAALLTLWGTTPGRWCCGLQLLHPLRFKEALKKIVLFRIEDAPVPIKWKQKLSTCLLLLTSFVATCIGPFGSPSFYSQDNWVYFYAPEKEFSVSLPTDPALDIQHFDVPNGKEPLKYNEYQSYPEEKTCYAVGFVDLPRKWKLLGSNRLLKGALELILKHEHADTLLGQQLVRHQKYPALDFHFSRGDEIIQGRLILVGRTLYKLTLASPSASEAPTTLKPFVESFGF